MDGSLASIFMEGNLSALPISWMTSGESTEELQYQLACTSMELESAKGATKAQEQLHEARLLCLQQLLDRTKKERDEARQECLKLQERLLSSSSSPSPSPSQAQDSPSSFVHSIVSSPISDAHQSWSLVSEQHVSTESQAQFPLQDLQALLDPATNAIHLHISKPQFSMEVLEDDFVLDDDQSLDLAELPDEQPLQFSWTADLPPSSGVGRSLARQLSSNSSSTSVPQPVQKTESECVSTAVVSSSTPPAVTGAFVAGVSSPSQGAADRIVFPLPQVHLPEPPEADPEVMLSSLPERGKLLQAVMQAGPLLQTLLLAGPLPQWRHPPPALSTGDIPKVSMIPSSSVSLPFTNQLPAFLPNHVQRSTVGFAMNSLSNSVYSGEELAGRTEPSSVSFVPNPCSRSRKLRKIDSTDLNGGQMMVRDLRFGAGPPASAATF